MSFPFDIQNLIYPASELSRVNFIILNVLSENCGKIHTFAIFPK